MTAPAVAELVERTRAASGVPERIEDPVVIRRIVGLLNGPETRTSGPKAARTLHRHLNGHQAAEAMDIVNG